VKKLLNITRNIAVKKVVLHTDDSCYLEHIWVEFPDKSNLIFGPFTVVANHIYYPYLKFLVKSKYTDWSLRVLHNESQLYYFTMKCLQKHN
jgi:hypothetical protein